MSLKSNIIKSYISSNILTVSLNILQFISKLILARLLAPEMFGTFASALSIIYILQQIISLGLIDNLIREKNEYFGNGFILHLTAGIIMILIVLIFAGNFAVINPLLPNIMRVFIFVLIPHIIATQAIIYFNRELLLQQTLFIGIIQNICNFLFPIIFALAGMKVWALILGLIVSKTIYAILLWLKLRKRIKLHITFRYTKILLSGSIFLFIINLVNVIGNNINNLILNYLLTSQQVGFYSMAFSITVILSFFEKSSYNILFPAFTKLKADTETTAALYKFATLIISFTEVILFMALINNADWLVPLFLDSKKWFPVITVLKWLSVLAIINPFAIYAPGLLQAHRKDRTLLVVAVLTTGTQIILSYIFIQKFRTTNAIVWATIIANLVPMIYIFDLSKIIRLKNIFFKEYFYHISAVICFSILYYTTYNFIYRIVWSIIIGLFFILIFYRFTLKKFFQQLNFEDIFK